MMRLETNHKERDLNIPKHCQSLLNYRYGFMMITMVI